MDCEFFDSVFATLPVDELDRLAKCVRDSLGDGSAVLEVKEMSQLVTQADTGIQRLLIDFFAGSAIRDRYVVKAEETIAADCSPASRSADLQLIIDPLDGTDEFVSGRAAWGTMVGIADREGSLVYSWNRLGDGTIYSSPAGSVLTLPAAWSEKAELRFDLFDYGQGASERFLQAFSEKNRGRYGASRVRLSSAPSAIVAGWQIMTGALDGLLWLASSGGKQFYPDYDLIFLGALEGSGWHSILGKAGEQVCMVVVAPDQAGANLLYEIGSSILPAELHNLTRCSGRSITAPLENSL